MDLFDYLLNGGNVLNAQVLVRVFTLSIIIELFGLASYWTRRF